jgi:Flp pilus assembly pilin Flp
MMDLTKCIKNFLLKEDGATVVEYSVMLALIIAVCILIIGVMGMKVKNSFNKFDQSFNSP